MKKRKTLQPKAEGQPLEYDEGARRVGGAPEAAVPVDSRIACEKRARELLEHMREDGEYDRYFEIDGEDAKLFHTWIKERLGATGTLPSNANDDTWENNAKYLLERCPHTVRVREGGGPENLMHSFIHTFMAMEQKLRSSHETREQRTRQAPIADDKLTLEVALREAERCRRYPDPVLNEQVIVVLADALHAQKASEGPG